VTILVLANTGGTYKEHPPYNQDLASSDFSAHPTLKEQKFHPNTKVRPATG